MAISTRSSLRAATAPVIASLDLRAGVTDRLAELDYLGADVLVVFVGSHRHRIGALVLELRRDVGQTQDLQDRAVQALDDRPRRAGVGEQAEPAVEHAFGHA